ncbi:hypothetical protein QCA50_011885 [Cerrena zonata]|uniref:Uncharacterized protein n=1 Tax=Cerrena zonata TaxID=2478898 RepID=A0AAW0FVE5_9APHY
MTVAVMTSYTSHPSFSAIHCGLRNIDILQIILYFLGPYPDRNEKTQDTKECSLTLARLARVCRAFKEPATAAIWRTLDGLDSILSLLPDTSFCTPELEHDIFKQLKSYSGFVQHLIYSGGVGSQKDISKLAFLYRISRGEVLLPNLCCLTLRCWPITTTEVSLLYSTDLRHFAIDIRAKMPELAASFGKLSKSQQ